MSLRNALAIKKYFFYPIKEQIIQSKKKSKFHHKPRSLFFLQELQEIHTGKENKC